jgi:hypothetical protein
MKKPFLLSILFFTSHFFLAQNIYTNYDINSYIYDVNEPLTLWKEFLSTKDDKLGSKFWNREGIKKYGDTSYFLLEKELQFGRDNFLELLGYSDIKILSVKKIKELYRITSLMEFKEKNDKSNIQYIFHVYAKKNPNGELKLYNAIDVNKKLLLKKQKVGYLTFYYTKNHSFDKNLANKMNQFLINFCNKFQVSTKNIDYYFTSNKEEMLKLKGLDYIIGNSGEEIPSGQSDLKNNAVYAVGLSEYYPHEVIHVLLKNYNNNTHFWINEGIATYFGKSRGKNLDWHLKKIAKYLYENKQINLNEILKLQTLDQHTSFSYALGGLVIKLAYEKGGYELVKKFLNLGKSDESFYKSIETNLGIKKENLNSFFRNYLKKNYL